MSYRIINGQAYPVGNFGQINSSTQIIKVIQLILVKKQALRMFWMMLRLKMKVLLYLNMQH